MSAEPSFPERRKEIIEKTLLEMNYLDENADVLADAILDALAANESADRVLDRVTTHCGYCPFTVRLPAVWRVSEFDHHPDGRHSFSASARPIEAGDGGKRTTMYDLAPSPE